MIGPQEEEYEFLVDTGAERTCVCNLPKGCQISKEQIRVMGAKGEYFAAPIIKQVMFKGHSRVGIGDVSLIPEAGCNLLGRDLEIQLKIGVVPEEGRLVVKILQLRQEDEKEIDEKLWAWTLPQLRLI